MLNTFNFDIDNDEYIYPSGTSQANTNIDVYVVDAEQMNFRLVIILNHTMNLMVLIMAIPKVFSMKLFALPPHGLYMDLSCDITISSGTGRFDVEGQKKVGSDTAVPVYIIRVGLKLAVVYHVDEKKLVLVDPAKNESGKIGMVYRIYLNTEAGVRIKIENFKMSVYYMAKMQSERIDVIKPDVLLNRLLKSINEENEGYVGEIEYEDDTRLSSTVIMAAESARGLDGAKIYTSFKHFSDWMEVVYGYVPDIAENKVVLRSALLCFILKYKSE